MSLNTARELPAFDIGTGPLKPDPYIMETGRVALDVYYGQERFEQERAAFGRVWLNIAETGEIPNPGDWIVRAVPAHSVSAIMVRGKDMKIRAFHNVCSHRGMKLLWDDKGKGGKFSCPYHAWTYDSLGTLQNIPDQACFPQVDKAASGLTPIACDSWEGFVFIHLDPAPKQSLLEYLGPVASRLQDVPFANYPYTARIGGVLETNWKLLMEAQSEAYHVRALHARTVSKMLSSAENPYIHPLDWQPLGAHRTKSETRNPAYEMSPEHLVQCFSFKAMAPLVVAGERSTSPEAALGTHPAINPMRSGDWGNDQYVLYPHFIFHVSFGGWWLHRFWPVAPDRTYWESVYHFETPRNLRSRFALHYALALNRDTLMEDNLAMLLQQQVMPGTAGKIIQFGEQEIVCKHLAAVSHAIANDPGLFPVSAAAE